MLQIKWQKLFHYYPILFKRCWFIFHILNSMTSPHSVKEWKLIHTSTFFSSSLFKICESIVSQSLSRGASTLPSSIFHLVWQRQKECTTRQHLISLQLGHNPSRVSHGCRPRVGDFFGCEWKHAKPDFDSHHGDVSLRSCWRSKSCIFSTTNNMDLMTCKKRSPLTDNFVMIDIVNNHFQKS